VALAPTPFSESNIFATPIFSEEGMANQLDRLGCGLQRRWGTGKTLVKLFSPLALILCGEFCRIFSRPQPALERANSGMASPQRLKYKLPQ
jgi:hypothetical protein